MGADMFQMANRTTKFISDLSKEKLIKKYLYEYTWLSGSSTTVYPIVVSPNYITLQWKSDKNIFKKFIERIVKENSDLLVSGYFTKSDGSCPSTITFTRRI